MSATVGQADSVTERAGPWANLLSPEAVSDPYGHIAALRQEHGPVFWSGRHRSWMVASFDEVTAGLRDQRLSSDRVATIDRRLGEEDRAALAPTLELLRGWMVFRDEPDHTRMRDPVRWAFTPRQMEGLRDHIAGLVERFVSEVAEAGTCDLVETFAFPLPAMVIAHLLGVPPADREKFGAWSAKLAALVFGAGDDPDRRHHAVEGGTEFIEYFGWLVAERTRRPADDLVSTLVAAQGDDGLSAVEVAGAATLLLFAGHETTADLLANGTVALSGRPDQVDLLRRQPELWPAAVEELIRYDAPAKVQTRLVTETHERAGQPLAEGDVAFLCLFGANRDPDAFPDPDRIDITRDARHHVGFGLGIHHCLGAPLARMEGAIGLRALFERCPDIQIAGDLIYEPLIASRSLTALPVQVA